MEAVIVVVVERARAARWVEVDAEMEASVDRRDVTRVVGVGGEDAIWRGAGERAVGMLMSHTACALQSCYGTE